MRVLVLHSGGMDSTTCLYQAKVDGYDVVSLGIDYGQRLKVEMLFAEKQCLAQGIPREIVSISWKKPIRSIPEDREIAGMRKSVSPAFLPGRNTLFLSIASAHAAGVGAEKVFIGLNCVEFSGYPDCTEEFFNAYKSMALIANPTGPSLEAPLLKLSKREIAAQAIKLGISKTDTWSCYQPQIDNGNIVPCTRCDACILHDHAWSGIE
jgi:7-cyano-7-deazaguanine synthase